MDTRVCRTCSRVNPPPAQFCYYDGVALVGPGDSGPIAVGARPFPSPFIFPSGRTCRTFDELVLTCETDWEAAQDVLRRGYLEGFLGGLGRGDLAAAARAAARESDPDRGLDDLLAQLPGQSRLPPLLKVQPLALNLGQLAWGTDRHFVLHLENLGMGLLYGTVACDNTPWLALGEAQGAPKKIFQCRHELNVPVHVNGKALRAGNRPLEGKLRIDSNAGQLTVTVRAEVPVRPFPEGVLAGASTPRQAAEKAKVAPRDAAPLFESGAVARWYEANGWTYPVPGPAASGLGAVQQFFEALGVTKPPRVEISERHVQLAGDPGDQIDYTLTVQAVERRPVYASAVSNAPWLQVGKVRLDGRIARIPLRVPAVPSHPGERLLGRVQVSANGNQRFNVEVALAIAGTPGRPSRPFRGPPGAVPPIRQMSEAWWQGTVDGGQDRDDRADAAPADEDVIPVVQPIAAEPLAVEAAPVEPVLELPAAGRGRVVALPEVLPAPVPTRTELPPVQRRSPDRRDRDPEEEAPRCRPSPLGEDEEFRRPGWAVRALRHLAALGVLVLALLVVVGHDLMLPAGGSLDEDAEGRPGLVDPVPVLLLRLHDGPKKPAMEIPPGTMCFGLLMKDPTNPDSFKRLMFDDYGRTNNTCVRVDDRDYLFGNNDVLFIRNGGSTMPSKVEGVTRWVQRKIPLGPDVSGRQRDGARSVWRIDGFERDRANVEVTQAVEVVPGEQSGKLDTCLVRYTLENKDDRQHEVGLRFLLDTYIGSNDGVPFTIPGRPGLCSTLANFDRPEDVPDYIQALENDDLLHPGTVAHLQFRLPSYRVESPTRVQLGGYPDSPLRRLGYHQANAWYTPWAVPRVSIRELVDKRGRLGRDLKREPVPDSAVTLYWDVRPLRPGERREVGFAYGLGQVASGEGEGKLLLTVGGRTVRDGIFTLTALRAEPVPGEKLTLTLPPGGRFELLGEAEQEVPPVPAGAARPISTVTWRIRAKQVGRSTLVVRSSTGVTQKQAVRISPPPQGVLD